MYKATIILWTKFPFNCCSGSAISDPSAPSRKWLARQSKPWPGAPVASATSSVGPTSPHLASALVTSHPEKHLGWLAIKAGGLAVGGPVGSGPASPWGQPPWLLIPPPAQPPAMPRTTAIVPWASPEPSAIDGETAASPPSLFSIQVCFLPPIRFLLAHSPEEVPVSRNLKREGKVLYKYQKCLQCWVLSCRAHARPVVTKG